MLVVKLAGTHVDRRRFSFFSTFAAAESFTCRMVVVKPADRRRFPAAAPDTMPFMIGDDGCAAGAGILRPGLDVPELAEALLLTAQIPIKMAALTKFILFLWFILPFPTWCVTVVVALMLLTVCIGSAPSTHQRMICSDG